MKKTARISYKELKNSPNFGFDSCVISGSYDPKTKTSAIYSEFSDIAQAYANAHMNTIAGMQIGRLATCIGTGAYTLDKCREIAAKQCENSDPRLAEIAKGIKVCLDKYDELNGRRYVL